MRKFRKQKLREAGNGISLSPISVDTQIDSLFVSFEDESSESPDVFMPENASIRSALRLLFEEEDADDMTTSKDKTAADAPADPITPKLNIDVFTEKVAMLIETYQKRLDVETVIYNRAKSYLEKTYDSNAAKQFEDIIINQHGIELSGEESQVPVAPLAKGAGPGPA